MGPSMIDSTYIIKLENELAQAIKERDEAKLWAERWRKYEGQPLYKKIIENVRRILNISENSNGTISEVNRYVEKKNLQIMLLQEENEDLRSQLKYYISKSSYYK